MLKFKSKLLHLITLITAVTDTESICHGTEPTSTDYPYSSQVRLLVTRIDIGGGSHLTKCSATAISNYTIITSADCLNNNTIGVVASVKIVIPGDPDDKTFEAVEWLLHSPNSTYTAISPTDFAIAMTNVSFEFGQYDVAYFGRWEEGNQPIWDPAKPGILCGFGETGPGFSEEFNCAGIYRFRECLDSKEYPNYNW